MLDIRLIREQAEMVRARLRQRGGEAWTLVDEVLSLDEARRLAETEKQSLQSERNRVSNFALQHSLQRARPEIGVVPSMGKPSASSIRNFKAKTASH